jgi:hypothetical protein
MEIIGSKAVDNVMRSTIWAASLAFWCRSFKLAPGEFIHVDANHKPLGRLDRAESC